MQDGEGNNCAEVGASSAQNSAQSGLRLAVDLADATTSTCTEYGQLNYSLQHEHI